MGQEEGAVDDMRLGVELAAAAGGLDRLLKTPGYTRPTSLIVKRLLPESRGRRG